MRGEGDEGRTKRWRRESEEREDVEERGGGREKLRRVRGGCM